MHESEFTTKSMIANLLTLCAEIASQPSQASHENMFPQNLASGISQHCDYRDSMSF